MISARLCILPHPMEIASRKEHGKETCFTPVHMRGYWSVGGAVKDRYWRYRYWRERSLVRLLGRSNWTQCRKQLVTTAMSLCCPDAKPWRWIPPLVTRFGVIASIMNIFFYLRSSEMNCVLMSQPSKQFAIEVKTFHVLTRRTRNESGINATS